MDLRFFIGFVFFIFMGFLVWMAFVFGEAGNPSKMSQWVFDAYEKKIAKAQSIKGKKMLIVAGSNTLFGVDSHMLSHSFDMPVVNMGVNAGIELPLTLHMAKKVIREGDIVVLPLEFGMYSYDGTAGMQMIDFLFSREKEFFFELTLYEQFYLLWHIEPQRVWDGYFDKSTKKVTQGLYGAHNIDELGDQINTSLANRSEGMYEDVLRDASKPQRYGEIYDKDALGWKYLEKFVKYCDSHNVTVVFMPSTLLKDTSYTQEASERWFYENLALEVGKRGWKFVGNPYAYMYDKTNYFNTNYHLIESAKKLRTKAMIRDLQGCF